MYRDEAREHNEESVRAEGEPELDDTPVTIQPRDPMASAYGVGDFVWLDGREYQITDLQRGYVELLPPGLPIPVYRTESRADFARLLRRDERNRYITDYLEQDATPGDAKAAGVHTGRRRVAGFPERRGGTGGGAGGIPQGNAARGRAISASLTTTSARAGPRRASEPTLRP